MLTVRLALLAVAVVPLTGAGWFATRELASTSRAKQETDEVARLAQEHAHLTRLRSFILDERNWTLVSSGVRELGVTNEMVKAFTGIDPASELGAAQAAVDGQLDSSMESVASALISLRSDDVAMTVAGDEYLAIERDLAARSDAVLTELLELGGDIDDGGDLINALRVLEFGTVARQAVTAQLTTYFAAQFSGAGDTVGQLGLLVAQQALHEQSTTALARVVRPGTVSAEQLEVIEQSEDVAAFRDAIGALVDAALRDGVQTSGYSPTAIFAQVDHVVAVFTAGARSSAAHLALVEAGAQDVAIATESISAATDSAARTAGLMFGFLAVTSFVAALVVGRVIVSPLRQVAERARRLRDGDMTADPPSPGLRELREVSAALAEAAANLALAESQARALAEGDLEDPVLRSSAPGRLGSSLQTAVRTLAASLDEREEFRRQLAHEAAHDALTGLPNRKASLRELQGGLARVRRNGASLAVMFVDLDGFKAINDGQGHQAGDAVLDVVARRLEEGVREGDHVGRLGGDEFLIVAEPVQDVEEAVKIARRVRAAITTPIEHNGMQLRVDASIGIALTDHPAKLTADELLRDADFAVYKAKQLGRGRIELCDDALRAEVNHSLILERSLRRAIEQDQFTMEYQPLVDPSANLIGLEALVRWNRPGHGMVPPGDFIPFAERSELIIDIENWVIEHVARQMSEWSDHPRLRDVPVAINISGRHFASEHVVDNILQPLARFGIDPQRVVIELTESSLIDVVASTTKLGALREAGARIAIDDFGTGYSSLGYLRSLPIDMIKIDRTFVADPRAEALVKVIIDAGHHIGALITAEGVETRSQADTLTQLGCDQLQGFYYSRPIHPQQVTEIEGPVLAPATAP